LALSLCWFGPDPRRGGRLRRLTGLRASTSPLLIGSSTSRLRLSDCNGVQGFFSVFTLAAGTTVIPSFFFFHPNAGFSLGRDGLGSDRRGFVFRLPFQEMFGASILCTLSLGQASPLSPFPARREIRLSRKRSFRLPLDREGLFFLRYQVMTRRQSYLLNFRQVTTFCSVIRGSRRGDLFKPYHDSPRTLPPPPHVLPHRQSL